MKKSKFKNLRKKYPEFIYESFEYKIINNDLEIVFSFKIKPNINFFPKIIIGNIDKKRLATVGESSLKNLIFHLGLIEMPSYWKATCSPKIKVLAGYLDKKQITWWKRLIIEGMGQFYYENKIDWRNKNFLKIISIDKKIVEPYSGRLKDDYLVPFAGGRDSIVTLESLKKGGKDISLFTVNPIEKIQKTAEVSGIKKQIIIKRIIDKKLLELNKKGFLNGHTPFTGVLSFISVLCAVLFDHKNIAFSNEKSSNEGNVKYLGKIINHQWAKSSAFEKIFSNYAKKYLVKEVNYFSYIRKYGELEISKTLAGYPQYFPVFSSCNAGMKISAQGTLSAKERWCGNCPKCLFVYLSLYPFLDEKNLKIIFGRDIFENKKLLPIMKNLIGKNNLKPLECVGTKKESQKALRLSIKKHPKNLPYLLRYSKAYI
jgi:UDP-N-acetyl-alpha-D-muramoyl-L-alanyl-L-glutamate epimerase